MSQATDLAYWFIKNIFLETMLKLRLMYYSCVFEVVYIVLFVII